MWYFVLLNPGPCRPCPNGGSRAEGEDAAQPEGGHRNEPDEARRRRRSYQKTNVPIAPKLHTRLHRRRAEHERGGNRKRGDAHEICPLLSSAEPKSTRAVADGYIVSAPRCDTYFTLYCSRARARFPSRAPARSLPRAPSQAAGSVESATTLSVETLKRVARTRPR